MSQAKIGCRRIVMVYMEYAMCDGYVEVTGVRQTI